MEIGRCNAKSPLSSPGCSQEPVTIAPPPSQTQDTIASQQEGGICSSICCAVMAVLRLLQQGCLWLWHRVFCCGRSSEEEAPPQRSEEVAPIVNPRKQQLEGVLNEFVAKQTPLERDAFANWWQKRFSTLDPALQKQVLLEEIAEHAPRDGSDPKAWAEAHFEEWQVRSRQFVVDLDYTADEGAQAPLLKVEAYLRTLLKSQ